MATDKARIINPRFLLSLPKWVQGKIGPLPEICFAGRSNVGKSSLINALVGQSGLAKTSATPGRTQAVVAFEATFRRGGQSVPFHLIDLPGYGFAKVPLEVKAGWRPMMESYFMKNEKIICCVMLLDIRRTPGEEERELLEMANDLSIPVLPVVTKVDKVAKTQRQRELRKIAEAMELEEEGDLRPVSATEKLGIADLLDELFEIVAATGDAPTP